MAIKPPQAPSHLTPASKRWWHSVVAEYRLEPHAIRLLTLAAEAWDRCAEARRLVKRDGLVVDGREGGMRPNPAVAIERDSRLAVAKLVAQLGLDIDEKKSNWQATKTR